MSAFDWWFIGVYLFLMVALSIVAIHRVRLAFSARDLKPVEVVPPKEWPTVLVQIPLYNERYVAERVIDAVCRFDYPKDKLTVQVLDDSTDGTSMVVAPVVEGWLQRGIAIEHIRRGNRDQYKAGALAHGLLRSKAEFVAVFDADFVPGADVLKQLVPSFNEPNVGMVQARWEHLNREDSMLTEAEAILLNGHFVNEHGGRFARGCFFNFNGTAGIWRRAAIDDAGGWSGVTLTEDLELSYRAQLRGWKFLYRFDVSVPGELPPDVQSFKAQQHRWAKGSLETAKILLPGLLRNRELPLSTRVEAVFHLAGNLAYPLVLLLTFLMPVTLTIKLDLPRWATMLTDTIFMVGSTGSLITFYTLAEGRLGELRRSIAHFPLVLSLGIAMAVNNTRAVVEAAMGKKSSFNRTPKRGGLAASIIDPSYVLRADWQAFAELLLGAYLLGGVILALESGRFVAVPFLGLFSFGFLYLSLGSLWRDGAGIKAQMSEQPLTAPAMAKRIWRVLTRLPFVVVSAAFLLLVPVISGTGAARFEAKVNAARRELAEKDAAQWVATLERSSEGMPDLVHKAVAADLALPMDLKLLVAAINYTEAGKPVPAAVQARITALATKVDERLRTFVSEHKLSGAALVSEDGVVVATQSSHYTIGTNLAPLAPSAEGEDTDSPNRAGLLAPVLAGATSHGLTHDAKGLYAWGGAPIFQKTKIAGAVVFERAVTAMPEGAGDAVLISEGKVILGQFAAGVDLPADFGMGAWSILQKVVVPAELPVIGSLVVSPMFAASPDAGIWGFGLAFKGRPALKVVVFADTTGARADLLSLQYSVLILCVALSVAAAVSFLLLGRSYQKGVTLVADFLSRLQQGQGGEKQLSERLVVRELHRLVRLVNKLVESAPGGIQPLRHAPSIDDVIKAQEETPASPSTGDFKFEGINTPAPPSRHEPPEAPLLKTDTEETENLVEAVPVSPPAVVDYPEEDTPAALIAEPSPFAASLSLDDVGEADAGVVGAAPKNADDFDVNLATGKFSPKDLPQIAKKLEESAPANTRTSAATLSASANDDFGEVEAAAKAPSAGPAGGDELLRQVHQEFLAARKSCGETGELGFEKFRARLMETRASVMAKHGCKDVRFQVYVKNGKAALKAQPAK